MNEIIRPIEWEHHKLQRRCSMSVLSTVTVSVGWYKNSWGRLGQRPASNQGGEERSWPNFINTDLFILVDPPTQQSLARIQSLVMVDWINKDLTPHEEHIIPTVSVSVMKIRGQNWTVKRDERWTSMSSRRTQLWLLCWAIGLYTIKMTKVKCRQKTKSN